MLHCAGGGHAAAQRGAHRAGRGLLVGQSAAQPRGVVFLLFVAPWQWTVTRLVVGGVVVVAGSALVARLVDGKTRRESAMPGRPELQAGVQVVGVPRTVAGDGEPVGASWLVQGPVRYGKALLRLVLTLVPEYLVVVLVLGAFRGWLFPIGHDAVSAGVGGGARRRGGHVGGDSHRGRDPHPAGIGGGWSVAGGHRCSAGDVARS